MPLSRLSARIVREEERQEYEERERRRALWVQFCAITFTARTQKEPPMTKEEYEEEKKAQKRKTPKEPTPAEWKQQAKARKQYEQLHEMVGLAAWHPAHFEQAFRYPTNLFGDPPEVPKPEEDKLTPKEREAISQAIFVQRLKERQAEMTG